MPAGWNFNSHPELDDRQFVIAAMNVLFGQQPSDKSVNDALSYMAAGHSRFELIFGPSNGWLQQGYSGNYGDNWFVYVPAWAWLVAGLGAAVGAIVIVLGTAKKLYWPSNGGSSSEY